MTDPLPPAKDLVIDEDFELACLTSCGRLSQADYFHSGVVELEVLDQIIADDLGTGLGQRAILVGVADVDRSGNDRQAKFILLQELPGRAECLFIL